MKFSTRTRHWLRIVGLVVMEMALICGLVAQESSAGSRIVSEKTDPATGARWVLMRDAEHPAAPAHWVLAEAGRQKTTETSVRIARQKLVIHSGDRIVVQEQTAVLNAWLEATALTSAENGGELRARLSIGGRVLAVRAIAPGTAEIEEETRR